MGGGSLLSANLQSLKSLDHDGLDVAFEDRLLYAVEDVRHVRRVDGGHEVLEQGSTRVPHARVKHVRYEGLHLNDVALVALEGGKVHSKWWHPAGLCTDTHPGT